MRVIAGSARRLNLKTVTSMATRPTTDRIKETLFNMINAYLFDATFLDLFAGSGQIGIEALSRGASSAVFVDNSKESMDCIQHNLTTTKLEKNAKVYNTEVVTALRRMEGNEAFDYIFMDPPYNNLLEKDVLDYLKDSSLVDENTVIIIEASLETEFEYLQSLGYELIKRKEYKTNAHIFVEKRKA